MKIHRFYLQDKPEVIEGSSRFTILDGELIHQWRTVLRFTEGSIAELFMQDGTAYSVKLVELTRRMSTWEMLQETKKDIVESKISLYMSIIKKDNFELIVQKATELGVDEIVPVLSSRSQYKTFNQDRLNKIIIEATEQSGGFNLPVITNARTLEEALNHAQEKNEEIIVGEFDGVHLQDLEHERNAHVALFIGPEGGWSEKDREAFEKFSATKISFGEKILRAETAAIIGVWEFGK